MGRGIATIIGISLLLRAVGTSGDEIKDSPAWLLSGLATMVGLFLFAVTGLSLLGSDAQRRQRGPADRRGRPARDRLVGRHAEGLSAGR